MDRTAPTTTTKITRDCGEYGRAAGERRRKAEEEDLGRSGDCYSGLPALLSDLSASAAVSFPRANGGASFMCSVDVVGVVVYFFYIVFQSNLYLRPLQTAIDHRVQMREKGTPRT